MQFKEVRNFSVDGQQGRVYEADDAFTVDRVISLIKQLETERARFYACYCSTFTESGTSWSPEFKSIDKLPEMNNFPNPSIGIRAVYINRTTGVYEFDISTDINSNSFTYQYDESMKDYIQKQIELDKMIEAKKKENNQETMGNTNIK